MSERREQGEYESLRIPELARQAGDFVRAIETATPDEPVSLEMLAGGEPGGIKRLLETRLQRIDELYDRHDELFFGDGIPTLSSLDLQAILALSGDVIDEARTQKLPLRTAILGLGILQFAQAGAAIARDPTLVLVESDETFVDTLADKSGDLVAETFHAVYGERLQGNIRAWPKMHEYLGHLEDTHLAFWKMMLVSAKADYRLSGLTESFLERVQKLMSQFSTKALTFDLHAAVGRPNRDLTRERYIAQMQTLQETLKNGESAGIPAVNNAYDALRFTMDALDTGIRYGYSADACLAIVAQNSKRIGRLTQRTTMGLPLPGTDMMRLEGPRAYPELIIDVPASEYESNFSIDTLATLQRRDQKGGHCPARYFVPLEQGGITCENINTLAAAIQKRTGIWPDILHERDKTAYVDLAALVVNYELAAIIANYDA